MWTFFRIGWRNLWRNKRRSLVVITSISLGVLAMLFSMGIMNGMNEQIVENTIRTSLGHLSIHEKGFLEDMKLSHAFVPPKGLLDRLRAMPDVTAFTPRLRMEGMIRSPEAARGVMILAIDPDSETRVSGIKEYMTPDQGGRFLTDPAAHEILISRSQAKHLDLMVGDRVVLMFQDRAREITSAALTVAGFYESPVESFDKFTVYMGIDAARKLGGAAGRVSEITVRLSRREAAEPTAQKLRDYLKASNLTAASWKSMAPNLVKAIALFDTMMYVFYAIIFTTVVFSIANTLIMAVMERFREIGVMKCIGTKPAWVLFMVMFEALNLGLVGLAAGVGVAGGLVAWLSVTGIDLSMFMASMRMWGTGHIIRPELTAMNILMSGVIVLGTTLLAAAWPAVRAARIPPLEALSHV